jgi:CDP-diacylglycerol--glycerol-3-phosphate 3-phosphatidyltransferase
VEKSWKNILLTYTLKEMKRHIPNIITFSRILVLIALFWLVYQPWRGAATWAFFAILYGSVSDFVDGWIARKYGFITNFGKIMDALVDKVMTLGAFGLLFYLGWLEPFYYDWWKPFMAIIIILMAVRETGITFMRIVAARKGVVLAAEKAGKAKTIWQVTAICVLFAVPMFGKDVAGWLGVPLITFSDYIWINGMMYFFLAAWLTIESGAMYLGEYWKVFTAKADTLNVSA